jgi:hypothetical protein
MRRNLWGAVEDKATPTAEKAEKIKLLLQSAWQSRTNTFEFYVPESASIQGNNQFRRVCEAGYLKVLGLSTTSWASDAPRPWLNAMKSIQNPSAKEEADLEADQAFRHKKMTEHATEFIRELGTYAADSSPGEFVYNFQFA